MSYLHVTRFVPLSSLTRPFSDLFRSIPLTLGTDSIEPSMTPLPDENSGTISRSSMTEKPAETEKKLPIGCRNRQKSLITKQMLDELAALPADEDDDGGLVLPAGVK